MRLLFLLFIIVPIVEMVVLIQVGSEIGAIPTIALVCLTAFVGVTLIRAQGFSTLQKAQWRVNHGELPAQEIVDGMCLAVGGAMLLTPGFITDAFGFLLLVPGLRKHLLKHVISRVSFSAQSFHSGGHGPSNQQSSSQPNPQSNKDSSTLEGEYWRDK